MKTFQHFKELDAFSNGSKKNRSVTKSTLDTLAREASSENTTVKEIANENKGAKASLSLSRRINSDVFTENQRLVPSDAGGSRRSVRLVLSQEFDNSTQHRRKNHIKKFRRRLVYSNDDVVDLHNPFSHTKLSSCNFALSQNSASKSIVYKKSKETPKMYISKFRYALDTHSLPAVIKNHAIRFKLDKELQGLITCQQC